jgi:LacI family transcriptional regulator
MAVNDDWGLLLLDACRHAGIVVPHEVAVIGVGNDDCLCDLADPPLSSVDLDPERVGYEAARRLDVMMSGRDRRPRQILVQPGGIAMRASTDVLATGDPVVVDALQFIRDRTSDGIRVADVLRHVGMSRGSLDGRMKAARGRTTGGEIRRARIERAKELLATTDVPIKAVAFHAGFRYPEYMMRTFRRVVGRTPADFRRRAGRGPRGSR